MTALETINQERNGLEFLSTLCASEAVQPIAVTQNESSFSKPAEQQAC